MREGSWRVQVWEWEVDRRWLFGQRLPHNISFGLSTWVYPQILQYTTYTRR